LLNGPADAAVKIGDRVSYSAARDAMDIVGASSYFARVVGPNPVLATLNMTATGVTHTINAKTVGDWANGAAGGLSVQVIQGPAGGASYRQYVVFLNAVEVERSPEFADNIASRQAVVDYSVSLTYVNITLGAGSGIPAVAAAANLAGGTDDRANAGETEWAAAINRFTPDLGPGQVSMLGRTTDTAHTNLLAHALASNRFALLDGPNTLVKATLLANASPLRALLTAPYGALYAPWVSYPGTAPGTTRTLPPSMFVARAMASNDATDGPNQPSAGDWGLIGDALGLGFTAAIPLTDLDYQDLNAAGVDMLRVINGILGIYGARTLADPATKPLKWKASNQRLEMLIKAECGEVGQQFQFREIDGQGITLAAWHGALTERMLRLYNRGDLYPDPLDRRPETAFVVETGPTVNTAALIADGILSAEIAYRPSSFAELVRVKVTNVGTATPIAA
jgi:hypothetical protein